MINMIEWTKISKSFVSMTICIRSSSSLVIWLYYAILGYSQTSHDVHKIYYNQIIWTKLVESCEYVTYVFWSNISLLMNTQNGSNILYIFYWSKMVHDDVSPSKWQSQFMTYIFIFPSSWWNVTKENGNANGTQTQHVLRLFVCDEYAITLSLPSSSSSSSVVAVVIVIAKVRQIKCESQPTTDGDTKTRWKRCDIQPKKWTHTFSHTRFWICISRCVCVLALRKFSVCQLALLWWLFHFNIVCDRIQIELLLFHFCCFLHSCFHSHHGFSKWPWTLCAHIIILYAILLKIEMRQPNSKEATSWRLRIYIILMIIIIHSNNEI